MPFQGVSFDGSKSLSKKSPTRRSKLPACVAEKYDAQNLKKLAAYLA
jgi:hypothetical protein